MFHPLKIIKILIRCLYEENEASFKNQKYLGKELQSEVENKDFEASAEEIPDTKLKPAMITPLDVIDSHSPNLVVNSKNYNIPADFFELPCRSSRRNYKILQNIFFTFLYAGSMEIKEIILRNLRS